ncbi:hypothetical protein HDE_00649 [Halotydeus destructor]|nr:hypothetical protein HDE_00649 [Halotydeus destructor]
MARVCIICLGTIVLFSIVLSFGEDDIDPDKDDPYSRGTATRIKSVEKLFFSGTPQYMAILMTVASDMRTESVACYNHLKMVADSVKSKKLAGFQIMDSTSGPSPVLSNQNSISKRSIRQCTDSVITGDVHANYCPAKIEIRTALTDKTTPLEHELKKRSPYNFGICLPPTCDSQLVQKTFQKYLKDTDLQVTISSKCVAHVAKITRSDVTAVATACLVAILAVVIASTYLDDIGHAKWQDGSGWRKALLNFSLKRNLIRLNSDFEDGANRNLYFVHGIRSFFILSSLWLNLWVFTSTFDPGHVDTGDMNHWTYTLIKNVSLSMYDAMFIISGLLVMYTWLPQFERGVAKFGRFLMTRWLRTIPTMSGVVLIAFALSPVTERDCQNWWSPLFFVNNWIHPHETVSNRHIITLPVH